MSAYAATAPTPLITPWDRFTLTLAVALLLHALIILGVTFGMDAPPDPRFDTMQVTLVYESSEAPDQATVLAQANLRGGGEQTPETPGATQQPEQQQPAQAPEAPPPEMMEMMEIAAVSEPEPFMPGEELLTAEDNPTEQVPPQGESRAENKPVPKPRINARSLLTNRRQIAALSAEIKRRESAWAKLPRRKFISANTREHSYASYMERWRRRVETLGNQNYPHQAIKRNLSGTLILTTALNADGTINDITLRKSSGHKILDEAALHIVRLGAPYAPFPQEIRREVDILHITRTWKFINNRLLY